MNGLRGASEVAEYKDASLEVKGDRGLPRALWDRTSRSLVGVAAAVTFFKTPNIINQIPDVLVRLNFSEGWHAAKSNPVFYDPKQFAIAVRLYAG